jgi:hypothetical protein
VIAAVAGGAWWLGTGRPAAPPELPAEQSLPIPVRQAAPAEPAAQETATDDAAPRDQGSQAVPRNSRVATGSAERRVVEREPAASSAGSRTREIFLADEPVAAAPPVTGPVPIILYHPDPNRGRVVQLGAFPTRAQAEDSWKRISRRYPYLASKPKMVNTVDVRGLGGGRPTRMYRLQLGTSSQAQSVVICQQLDRAGHSCVVVY